MISAITSPQLADPAVFGSPVDPAAGQGFEKQLFDAIANSLARLGSEGARIQVNVQETTSQIPGTAPNLRQYMITVTPVPAGASAANSTQQAGTITPTGLRFGSADDTHLDRLPAIRSNKLSYKDMDNPIPYVQQEMQKLGLDPNAVTFELLDEAVQNLGGDYVNHHLRAHFSNGQYEDFAVEYALRSPRVTAGEIQTLLRTGADTLKYSNQVLA